ncbi:hypothetical protein RND81_03G063500 [Saponaria officinalis]|uniref:Uncharacterized protein n=1 Tax=Saponaria officinalis TaxID=3572 RepID=A0AAW1M3X6_SAPOF
MNKTQNRLVHKQDLPTSSIINHIITYQIIYTKTQLTINHKHQIHNHSNSEKNITKTPETIIKCIPKEEDDEEDEREKRRSGGNGDGGEKGSEVGEKTWMSRSL